ncbi:Epithelial sodium channel [Trinorchestia longiramus]|nr:Epithelial sodium channel [Trinorchestia longiramus]
MSKPGLHRDDDDLCHQRSFEEDKKGVYYGYFEEEDSWVRPTAQPRSEEEEHVTRGELLRMRTRVFMESVTTHGLAHISRSENVVRRLVWLGCFLACLIYGLLQCYNVYQEYSEYPKSIAIEMKMDRKVDFPAITLCNLNPINNEDLVRDHDFYGAFVKVQEENLETSIQARKDIT